MKTQILNSVIFVLGEKRKNSTVKWVHTFSTRLSSSAGPAPSSVAAASNIACTSPSILLLQKKDVLLREVGTGDPAVKSSEEVVTG